MTSLQEFIRRWQHMHGEAMKMFAVVLAMLAVSSCGMEMTLPKQELLKHDVEQMQFIRHPNGGCFGVVQFNVYSTELVYVPSEMCGQK